MNLSIEEINLLRQGARNIVRELGLLNDAYFDIDVTLAERHFLIELSSSIYPTVKEISERLLLDKSTASRLIAKAVKKGYVKYSSDENDKRKKFLQLTKTGKETLSAFEPIAFNQTKTALLTLKPEEIETAYRGITLYAKGLKTARLQSKISITPIISQDIVNLAHLLLKERSSESIEQEKDSEWNNLFESYHKKGFSYLVMKMDSKIIGGGGISLYHHDESTSCELGHFCIQSDMHGFGFERILIDSCLQEAKRLGYDQCCVDITKETLLSSEFFQELGFQLPKKNKKKESFLWKAC